MGVLQAQAAQPSAQQDVETLFPFHVSVLPLRTALHSPSLSANRPAAVSVACGLELLRG